MTIALSVRIEGYESDCCYFCAESIEEERSGIACLDCARLVFDYCEGCEEPTYVGTSMRFPTSATFSERAALAIPGATDAARSFLPSAFGITDAPRMRILTEDEGRNYLTCSRCTWDCENCGAPFADQDRAYECCEPRYQCEECLEPWETESGALDCCGNGSLRDYSYSPRLNFWSMDGLKPIYQYRADPSELYLGMELELERATDGVDNFLSNACEDPSESPSFLWTKSDGSLGAGGVELVTMPSTYRAFRAQFPFDALERWNRDGARSYFYESCGLHIHVSRSAFDAPHLWRFVRFQLWNAPLCQLVAQREESHYAQWSESGRVEENRYGSLPDFIKGKDSNRNRYVALNFQNGATVELRYFKGNLTRESILTKLGFVDSLYQWTKQLTYQDCASGALRSPQQYFDWMQSASDYPELIRFLTEREAI